MPVLAEIREAVDNAEETPEVAGADELAARAQSGDDLALDELLLQFEPLLRARAQKLWIALQARLSGAEWDDVHAQVRLIFLTRLRDFEPHRGVYFAFYISRMLDLDCRAWLRSQNRRETPWSQLGLETGESDDFEGAIEYSNRQENSDASDPTEQLEQAVSLRAALSTLTEAQREVIWRCCVLEKTEVAVAQELGISRSAVRNRLAGALAKMRAFFQDENAREGDTTSKALTLLAARTGRAAPQEKERQRAFWLGRTNMAKDDKRPDLVGVGTGKPVLLQGVFDFPATGLRQPQLLSRKLSYTIPPHCVAGIRYLRVGVQCDSLVCISTVVNGDAHRLIPVAPNATVHIAMAIVEPIIAGSQIEIHVASDSAGTAVIDVGCLQMPA